jgi:hypothetical protein
MPVIGFLNISSPETTAERLRAFRQGLGFRRALSPRGRGFANDVVFDAMDREEMTFGRLAENAMTQKRPVSTPPSSETGARIGFTLRNPYPVFAVSDGAVALIAEAVDRAFP